jgi:hypothetical protein
MADLSKMFLPQNGPVLQQNPRYDYDPYGNFVDLTRPKIQNPDGTFSTEESATELFTTPDGPRYINFPTIVNGTRLSLDDAIMALQTGSSMPTGSYPTLDEALRAARARTQFLGQRRENN